MRVLVTRPSANSQKTISRLEKNGHDVFQFSLLKPSFISNPIPNENYDGILVTSSFAAEILDSKWTPRQRDIKILTTGNATRDILITPGFSNVISMQGDALQISENIDQHFPTGSRLLYPRAETIAQDLSAILFSKGYDCHDWIVYKTTQVMTFDEPTTRLLLENKIDSILLYSTRSAQALNQCYKLLMSNHSVSTMKIPKILVLSLAIKNSLEDSLKKKCIHASHPDEDSLMSLI